MNLDLNTGLTGLLLDFIPAVETREIIVVEGLEFHDADILYDNSMLDEIAAELDADPLYWKKPQKEHAEYIDKLKLNTWGTDAQKGNQIKKKCPKYKMESDLTYLEKKLGAALTVAADRSSASYFSVPQGVNYHLTFKKHSIRDLLDALENEEAIVVYSGHARYGRGPCLDVYDPPYPKHGNQWESGDDVATDGIFRMGYRYIPVELSDLEHHRYIFRPVPVEEGPIPNESNHPKSRHPDCRRALSKISLPAPYAPDPSNPTDIYNAADYVAADSISPSGKYWGFGKKIILKAGWESSSRAIFNLEDVDLKCRTFCYFGCSTQLHSWDIFRKQEYKNWVRFKPPIGRLAYFTTKSADWRTAYWLYFLLTCDKPCSIDNHLFETHEYAKEKANKRLFAEEAGFQIY